MAWFNQMGELHVIWDLSVGVHEGLATWPGDPPPAFHMVSHRQRGDVATVHQLRVATHAGTHVDAPSHFIEGGADVASLSWEGLVGWAAVVDTGNAAVITESVLDRVCPEIKERILLLKTRNSHRQLWRSKAFRPDFTGLDVTAARWALARGIRGVGIDYLSIEPVDTTSEYPVHRAFLEASPPVVIIEGLDLSRVEDKRGWLTCLPLNLPGMDGAPARAILETRMPGQEFIADPAHGL